MDQKCGQPMVWFISHTGSGLGCNGLVEFLNHWCNRALALFELPRLNEPTWSRRDVQRIARSFSCG
jgi:hypothetical protein